MVATFYCFLTQEVRSEVRKRIKRWRWNRDISGSRRASRRSRLSTFQQTQVTNQNSVYSSAAPANGGGGGGGKGEDGKGSPLIKVQTNVT